MGIKGVAVSGPALTYSIPTGDRPIAFAYRYLENGNRYNFLNKVVDEFSDDLNMADELGWSPLAIAIRFGKVDCASLTSS